MIRKILLNPGPTNTSVTTKLLQWIGSDQCHREDTFLDKMNNVQEVLRKEVYNSNKGIVAIMGGSGTTALEAMIASLMEDGTTIVKAGKYGQRAIEIAKTFGIEISIIESSNIDDLEKNKNIKNIYFVENETSTGENYSLEKMCKIYPNAKFLIDSTSAFGASDYRKFSDKIIGLSFCSNKCLQSTPGLGIVIWDGKQKLKHRTYYGDLSKYGPNKLPFTIPTQCLYALEQSINTSIFNKKVFDLRSSKIIKDFELIGIKCLNVQPSNSIIGFKHPVLKYDDLQKRLSKVGIVIYSGIEGVERSFRISTMSYIFDKEYKRIIRSFYETCIS